jgi:ZIP family zinc transporter
MSDGNLLANPLVQVLLATCFTWFMTGLGASTVFLTKNVGRRLLDASLGFAAGVMISVSFFSLLLPAATIYTAPNVPQWFPVIFGFLLGALFLGVSDRLLPHVHPGAPCAEAEGIHTTWKRNRLLVLAMVLHHIPEGLAIGVAFAAAALSYNPYSLMAAITLAIGMGIHNFPEGMAVAMPMRAEGKSALKSFWYGQLSGVFEPLSAFLGFVLVAVFQPLLPYALGFAAGAMIYVAVEELIPECQRGNHTDLATFSLILGFALMMGLNIGLS